MPANNDDGADDNNNNSKNNNNNTNEWKRIFSALKAPLFEADRLRVLLKGTTDDFDINAPRFGEDGMKKPLLHAILYYMQSGDLSRDDSDQIFRVLDECGADANQVDDEGITPLSIVLKGRYDMQDELVEILGADATKEQSCFDDAVAELDYDNKDVCGRLIRLGLKPEADGRYTRLLFKGRKKIGKVKCFERMLEKLIEWNLILPDSERDAKQNTPLHYAVRVLDCNFDSLSTSEPEEFISNKEYLANNLCTTLLDHGANPLARNAKGKTALDVWLKHREILVGDTDDVEELLLNRMADARECLLLKMMDCFAQTDMGKRLDAEIIDIIKEKTLFLDTPRGKRFIRCQKLDAMLAAEGITPDLHKCVNGYYYHRCINGEAEIDMAEFRFRHYIATTGAVEYEEIVEDIVKQLRRDHRQRSYAGIHEEARDVIGGRLRKRGVCFS